MKFNHRGDSAALGYVGASNCPSCGAPLYPTYNQRGDKAVGAWWAHVPGKADDDCDARVNRVSEFSRGIMRAAMGAGALGDWRTLMLGAGAEAGGAKGRKAPLTLGESLLVPVHSLSAPDAYNASATNYEEARVAKYLDRHSELAGGKPVVWLFDATSPTLRHRHERFDEALDLDEDSLLAIMRPSAEHVARELQKVGAIVVAFAMVKADDVQEDHVPVPAAYGLWRGPIAGTPAWTRLPESSEAAALVTAACQGTVYSRNTPDGGRVITLTGAPALWLPDHATHPEVILARREAAARRASEERAARRASEERAARAAREEAVRLNMGPDLMERVQQAYGGQKSRENGSPAKRVSAAAHKARVAELLTQAGSLWRSGRTAVVNEALTAAGAVTISKMDEKQAEKYVDALRSALERSP